MGFMDKAKEAAKQAQAKLDEAQTKFNESQAQRSTGESGEQPAAPVQYDSAGRPIQSEAPLTPPAPAPAAEAPAPPDKSPPAPSEAPAPPAGDSGDEYTPPGLSSGDPLAG